MKDTQKKNMNNRGQITIGAVITIAIFLAGGITTSYFKNDAKAQKALDNVASVESKIEILDATINTKLDFLLADKGYFFDKDKGTVIRASSTQNASR